MLSNKLSSLKNFYSVVFLFFFVFFIAQWLLNPFSHFPRDKRNGTLLSLKLKFLIFQNRRKSSMTANAAPSRIEKWQLGSLKGWKMNGKKLCVSFIMMSEKEIKERLWIWINFLHYLWLKTLNLFQKNVSLEGREKLLRIFL